MSSDARRKNDPSTTSLNYDAMAPVWAKVSTILAGTEAMRAAGTAYLPQHENEKHQRYRDRLESTTLKNTSALTLDSWVGRPFSDPVVIDEEIPSPLVEDMDDVDLQGNNVSVFCREWFKEGLSKAFAHVLVDHPQRRGDQAVRTLADDRRENLRPYWSLIRPENLIFASADVVNGREVLTHVRIHEVEVMRDGFAEIEVERIRVFDRVTGMADGREDVGVFFSTWIKRRDAKKGENEWTLEMPPQRMDIDEIPLVTFYADRKGLMIGKSPLEDLVDLNIEHWQSRSDQRSILTMGRFPMLAVSGLDSDEAETVVVGPKQVLATESDKAKWYYVEPTGKAIEAGEKDLDRLERCMAEYGADFLRKRESGATATARVLDSAEATSPLQDAALRFVDAMNRALDLSAKWRKLEVPTGAGLSVVVDFGPEDFFPGDMDTLTKARAARDISRGAYLNELKRRGALDEEFDPKENERELEEEAAAALANMPTEIDPQQTDGKEDEGDAIQE